MKQPSAFHEATLPLFAESDEAVVTALPEKLPSYIADHRSRLRSRFLDGGAQAMPDYEMLELVLFRAIPRQDVKPLARLLLDTFGDFNRVVTASPARLHTVKGVGAAVVLELKIVEAAAQRMMRARVMNRPVLSSWDALLDYCHTAMAHRETEQFRILFLDRKNVLIADEEQAKGTVDHVPVYPREVVKRALALNAGAPPERPRVEVILLSRNSSDTGLRIFNAIGDITAARTPRLPARAHAAEPPSLPAPACSPVQHHC
mgnify:CR=1 FL=1